MKELATIQQKLHAPKTQVNSFAKYKYRTCADILGALKPLLAETGCTLTLNDSIELVLDRVYICATATLRNGEGETESVKAYAREALRKAGSDEAQVTGAASSYARKYALNGLFAIDDTPDPDVLAASAPNVTAIIKSIKECATEAELNDLVRDNQRLWQDVKFQEAVKARREALKAAATNA